MGAGDGEGTEREVGIAAAAAKSLQSCVTPCDPIDSSPPGSSVPGILQARILEWVAISFSNACMHAKSFQSCPTLWDPLDSSPPGSSVHGILQARILEWVAIPSPEVGISRCKLVYIGWINEKVLSYSTGNYIQYPVINTMEKNMKIIYLINNDINYYAVTCCFSRVQLYVTPWSVAHQAPLSMGFSRHKYWNGLPCPPPGDLPNPGIEPASPVAPALQANPLSLSHQGSPIYR